MSAVREHSVDADFEWMRSSLNKKNMYKLEMY